MNHKWIAALLSAVVVFTAGIIPVTAQDVTPPTSKVVDISKGNIFIDQRGAFYSDETGPQVNTPPNAAGYKIIGVQGLNTLTINQATVPVQISTDVKLTGAVVSSSTVDIDAGKNVYAPYIQQVVLSAATSPSAITVKQYPVVVQQDAFRSRQVTVTAANLLLSSIPPTHIMNADAEGKLYLWLTDGNYNIQTQITGTATSYPFRVTVNQAGAAISNAPMGATQTFASGSGTQANPYLISTSAQFANIANDLNAYYKLSNNLSISAPIAGTFTGTLEGNGKIIALGINGAGLFEVVNGTVQNLVLTGAVNSSGSYAGSLAGIIESSGRVSNVYSTATVTASGTNATAGGIAGENRGIIENVRTGGIITGVAYAGGIAGIENSSNTIRYSYSTAKVSAPSGFAGGIAGDFKSGTLQNTYALNESVTGYATGRIAGNASGTLTGNYAWDGIRIGNAIPNTENTVSGKHGAPLTNQQIAVASTFSGLGSAWTFVNGKLPALNALGGGVLGGTGQSTTIPTAMVYTPPSSGGSGNGNGGGEYVPTYSETFWEDMIDRIKDASSGDVIKFNTAKLENMPVSILKLIKGKNITFEITHGKEKFSINGKKMYDIPKNRIFYPFDELAKLYKNPPASSSSSSTASSSKPAVNSTPTPPAPTQSTPVYIPPSANTTTSKAESSSSEASSSSQPEPESEVEAEPESKPEDIPVDTKPETPKRSKLPLVIAGAVILLALAGGGAAFYFGYYRRRTENFYDLDDN